MAQLLDGADDSLQRGPFAAQVLGALRVVPNAGLGEFQLYLGEAVLAVSVVKDTP
jgi:hypothetical protein